MPWIVGGAALVGATGNYLGAKQAGKSQTTYTDQQTEPWIPTQGGLMDAFNDATVLYQQQMGQQGKYGQPPPQPDLGHLYAHLGYQPPLAGGTRQQYRRTNRNIQSGRAYGPGHGGPPQLAAGGGGGGAGGFDAASLAQKIEATGTPAKAWDQMTAGLSDADKKQVQKAIVQLRAGGGASGGGSEEQASLPKWKQQRQNARAGGGGSGGGGGGGGGGAGGGITGRQAIVEQMEQGNPALDAAIGYAERSLTGFDPIEHLNRYLSGEDGMADSALNQAARDMIRRRYEQQYSQIGDTFAGSGLGAGSHDQLRQSLEKQGLGDALVQYDLGQRSQNIGLLQNAMAWQTNVMGQVPALEEARFIGPKALSDHDLQQAAIQAQIKSAQIAASAQRYSADRSLEGQKYSAELSAAASRYATDAQRYSAELSHRASMANVGVARQAQNQQQRQWEFGELKNLANIGYQNQLNQYNYDQSMPGAYIDQYLGRALPIAGAGSRTYGTNVVPGQQTNPYASAMMGGLGGAAIGAGVIPYVPQRGS